MANNGSSYRMSAFPVTVFSHLLAVSIATLVLYWLLKLREGVAFTSHVKIQIFNAIKIAYERANAYRYFLSAIITYKGILATRQALKLIHLVLHLLALFAGILGICAVFKFHNELKIAHAYTLHSWTGLSTICLFGLQLLLGFVTFLFPGAKSGTRARFAPWHIFTGVVVFFMAIVTAETGLMEVFMFQKLYRGQEALVVNFIGLLVLVFWISVGLIVVLPSKRK
ncbi:putative ascorbate ferrireductase (transmembrane) [Helianthus annuus]|uniref:ascorbate ferrireductase (transmembrane) n=1 Tax=Helianthus annuus TaxID=4232 RepID=A0A251S2I7_HELAN|nr:putative ascorbate ferrireductase (transmembrane) [Helianthus annuus]KAJ0462144.1 putative ascorbate ferrireductase (transmembrane) [Helianthus annuus]KAJ0823087.1 putative ascorbate ferrireductase (transmembrane) [Helianthus annuus]